jgi:tetratricopeptide (TPR) repeat protein
MSEPLSPARPSIRSRFAPVPVAAALVFGACAAPPDRGSQVPELVSSGQYVRAVEVAEQRYRADPNSARAESEYRTASLALQLAWARQATLDDRDDEALAILDAAEDIDPGNPYIADWRLKTNRKLATIWLDHAQEFSARQELANALDAFETALAYDPDNLAAEQGRIRMLLLMNYREGVGLEYFKDGVRSMRQFALQRARVQFEYTSEKYIPGHEQAAERGRVVEGLLAEESVEKAREFEAGGKYFAAGNEYRIALLYDPENLDATDGRTRMEREMGAQEQLDHAEWLRLRGRFDEARGALDEGRELTAVQLDAFEAGMIDIDQNEYTILYEEALRRERDFRYIAAIEAYDELLKVAGYYEDAITRRSTLHGFVQQARDLYDRAQATSDTAEKVSLLRQVQLVWPEYRDVDEVLAELDPQRK